MHFNLQFYSLRSFVEFLNGAVGGFGTMGALLDCVELGESTPYPESPPDEEPIGDLAPAPEREIKEPSIPPAPPTEQKASHDFPQGVDKTGLPWDSRIHAKAKQPMKADGTWKRRKGIDKDYYAQIEAEIRGTRSATPPPPPLVTDDTPPPVGMAVKSVTFPDLMALASRRGLVGADLDRLTQEQTALTTHAELILPENKHLLAEVYNAIYSTP